MSIPSNVFGIQKGDLVMIINVAAIPGRGTGPWAEMKHHRVGDVLRAVDGPWPFAPTALWYNVQCTSVDETGEYNFGQTGASKFYNTLSIVRLPEDTPFKVGDNVYDELLLARFKINAREIQPVNDAPVLITWYDVLRIRELMSRES